MKRMEARKIWRSEVVCTCDASAKFYATCSLSVR